MEDAKATSAIVTMVGPEVVAINVKPIPQIMANGLFAMELLPITTLTILSRYQRALLILISLDMVPTIGPITYPTPFGLLGMKMGALNLIVNARGSPLAPNTILVRIRVYFQFISGCRE